MHGKPHNYGWQVYQSKLAAGCLCLIPPTTVASNAAAHQEWSHLLCQRTGDGVVDMPGLLVDGTVALCAACWVVGGRGKDQER